MNLVRTRSCCGVYEICELREHPTPEEAMKVFLKATFSEGVYTGQNLYLFNGVRKYTSAYKPAEKPTIERYQAIYGNDVSYVGGYFIRDLAAWEKEQLQGYSGRFAAYIRKHRLGKVVEAPFRFNKNYMRREGKNPETGVVYQQRTSGGHLLEAYLWSPNIPALQREWEKLKGVHPLVEPRA